MHCWSEHIGPPGLSMEVNLTASIDSCQLLSSKLVAAAKLPKHSISSTIGFVAWLIPPKPMVVTVVRDQ